MAYKIRTRDEHFLSDGGPKRILALDGGGLRGILTLSYLAAIEALLRERHGGAEGFRLSHYFDLIAGTSTGAIIAAALAQGMTVAEIRQKYLELGQKVFRKSWLRKGFVRALYDQTGLIRELKKVYGSQTTLGDEMLQTGLLIVTKRLNSGSPWPITNNPQGKYFNPRPESNTIANSAYPLWQVVRASTAAPGFFDPERIRIARGTGGLKSVDGDFVDGGVSPFNNPALQALMYVTLSGYRVGWPLGAEKLLLVSVGTGAADPAVTHAALTAKHAINSLLSMMDDCAALMETLLQWMSNSPTAREIDRDIGDLRGDSIAPTPLIGYLRYNVSLTPASLERLNLQNLQLDAAKIEGLSAMDDPANMPILEEIGARGAAQQVRSQDFPSNFNLR